MFTIEKFISVLVCLLSKQCTALLPRMETQAYLISMIFLLAAGSVSFLFRASVCTPIEDQAKSEAAYITWVLSICACVLFYFELAVQGPIQEAKYTVIYEALPRCETVIVFTHIPKCVCTTQFFLSL